MTIARLVPALLILFAICSKLTEWYLESLLFNLLAKEVSIPTGCSLEARIWDVNLFSRSGFAEDVRIRCEDGHGESFPVKVSKIFVAFQLSEILERRIILDMYISSAESSGFWRDSVLYKFIDYLSLEPESSPVLRLKLRNLKVANMQTTETVFNLQTTFRNNYIEYYREESGRLKLKIWTGTISNDVISLENVNVALAFNEQDVAVDSAVAKFLNGLLTLEGRFSDVDDLRFEYTDAVTGVEVHYTGRRDESKLGLKAQGESFRAFEFLLNDFDLSVMIKNPLQLFSLDFGSYHQAFKLLENLIKYVDGSIRIGQLNVSSDVAISNLELLFEQFDQLRVKAFLMTESPLGLADIDTIVKLRNESLIFEVYSPVVVALRLDLPSMSFDGTAKFKDYDIQNIQGLVRANKVDFGFEFYGARFGCQLDGKGLECINSVQTAMIKVTNGVEIKLNNFSSRYGCATVEATGQILFTRKTKLLSVQNLAIDFDCQYVRDRIQLGPVRTDITEFNVGFPVLSRGGELNFRLRGDLSRFTLTIRGDFNPSKVFVLPVQGLFYNLQSLIDASFAFDWFRLVSVTGGVRVQDGQLRHVSGLLDASGITGDVEVVQNKLLFKAIQGTLNRGAFVLKGEVSLEDRLRYALSGDVERAVVSTDYGSVVVNGLLAAQDEINLTIEVVDASIKVPERSLFENLIARSRSETVINLAELVTSVPFSITLRTAQSISVESDKFSAKLWGGASVINRENNIDYSGALNFVDGFVNISSNSFPIRRGQVRLDPVAGVWLDMECSRNFYYARSFPVEVFVSIKGPVLEPDVQMYSIPRLEQDQIQRIVLTRDPAFFNMSPRGVTILKDSDIPLEFIPKFLRDSLIPKELALDVKSTEADQTAYAVQFGKEILPDLQLLAESVVYDNYTVNNLKLKLGLQDRIDVIGEISDNPLLSTTGFSADVLFKLLGGSDRTIYQINGASDLNRRILERQLPRLPFVNLEDVSALANFISTFYQARGFKEVDVKSRCIDGFVAQGEYVCRRVRFDISEGRVWSVKKIVSDVEDDFIKVPVPLNWSTMHDARLKYIEKRLKSGFVPMDISENITCEVENGVVSCVVSIRSNHGKVLHISSNLDKPTQTEILKQMASMQLFGPNIPASALAEFGKLWGLKSGTFVVIDLANTNEEIRLSIHSKPLEVIPSFENADCPIGKFTGASLENALAAIKDKLGQCGLYLESYSVAVDEAGVVSIKVNAGRLSEKTLVFPQFPGMGETRIVQYSDSQLKTIVQNRLLREGIVADLDYAKFFDSDNKISVFLNDFQQSTIGEIKLVFISGVRNSDLINHVQRFRGAPASDQSITNLRQVIESFRVYKVISSHYDNATGTLEVLVDYVPRDLLKVGLGYHSDLGIHLVSFAENQSLFFKGQILSGKLDLYLKEDLSVVQSGSVSVSYTDPLVNFERFQLESFGSFQRVKQSQLPFSSERYTASIALNRLGKYFLKPKAGIHHDFLFDVNGDLDYSSSQITSPFVGLEGKAENLNSVTYPTEGYTVKSEILAGFMDFDYFELRNLATKHASITDSLSSHLSLKYNQIFADQRVPLPYRYFAGGRDTVRGYSMFKLGKKGVLGSALGGERFIGSQNELHYTVSESMILTGFADLGLLDDFDKDSFGLGIGVGLKYLSPIGPVGIEVARGIYDNDSARDLAFYLSLGLTF